jgi:hypothetical protein
VAEVRGRFGNPEERERPRLESVTRELVKTVTEDTKMCVCVCFMYKSKSVVINCALMFPINPIANPNPVCIPSYHVTIYICPNIIVNIVIVIEVCRSCSYNFSLQLLT